MTCANTNISVSIFWLASDFEASRGIGNFIIHYQHMPLRKMLGADARAVRDWVGWVHILITCKKVCDCIIFYRDVEKVYPHFSYNTYISFSFHISFQSLSLQDFVLFKSIGFRINHRKREDHNIIPVRLLAMHFESTKTLWRALFMKLAMKKKKPRECSAGSGFCRLLLLIFSLLEHKTQSTREGKITSSIPMKGKWESF